MLQKTTAEFTAILVGQGDAFFLNRPSRKILVDGGRSVRLFPQQFSNQTGQTDVDVLICTHNDADHADGVLGFLLSPDVGCRELWLPGTWTWRLKAMVTDPCGFASELVGDIQSLSSEVLDDLDSGRPSLLDAVLPHTLEAEPDASRIITERDSAFRPKDREHREHRDRELSESDWFTRLDAWALAPRGLMWGAVRPEWFHPGWIQGDRTVNPLEDGLTHCCFGGSRTRARLMLQAVAAGDRIRDIYVAARRSRHILPRWFEYSPTVDPHTPRGGEPDIVPVNAREIFGLQSKPISALCFLALSVQNQESLVFQVPPSQESPGVLFTADSNLHGCEHTVAWTKGMIATAPHHGAKANRDVYSLPTVKDVVWVRSDGNSTKRPCSEFHRQGTRYCTRCPKKATAQTVRLVASQGHWNGGLTGPSTITACPLFGPP